MLSTQRSPVGLIPLCLHYTKETLQNVHINFSFIQKTIVNTKTIADCTVQVSHFVDYIQN